uniref:Uncharacterized protein n=1 Tax=Kwoniella pini CBS 10737 TaxID=1296096 RepID=A0A1B9I0A0_9TREE|nr:uncharacterized protein I206_04632 [Kwoniella pini CBS 10737]OCF48945.1 hypothetical protein I206_04632 [Kwoniella pini CBS 10737]
MVNILEDIPYYFSYLRRTKTKCNNFKSSSSTKKHKSNFFQLSLHITNLPSTIKPLHFNYILSNHIQNNEGFKRKEKINSGINMIQIYHLPISSSSTSTSTKTKTKTKKSKFKYRGKIFNNLKTLFCISNKFIKDENENQLNSQKNLRILNKLNNPIISPVPIQQESRVEEREVINFDDHQETNLTSTHEEARLVNVNQVIEEVETVAWIHFINEESCKFSLFQFSSVEYAPSMKTEIHLRAFYELVYRAKDLLRSITIDGRKIIVKTDRFNSGLIKKFWKIKD